MINQGFLTEKSGVPGDGLEPSRIIHPRDFKSLVSTNSTTRATKLIEASAGFEPANDGFANRSLKPLVYDAIKPNTL